MKEHFYWKNGFPKNHFDIIQGDNPLGVYRNSIGTPGGTTRTDWKNWIATRVNLWGPVSQS